MRRSRTRCSQQNLLRGVIFSGACSGAYLQCSSSPGYTSADEDEWYGSTLLAGTIKTSPAYEHYLRLCQMTDQGALLSQSSSQIDLYRACDNLAPSIGGLEGSDKELEARLAHQFEMLSSFDSFMREGQDGLVCV
jgi:hypothetical protein